MDLFESFATATFAYDPLKDLPLHPIIFYNIKTQAPVKIDVLPDTGASITVLDMKYAKLLGVEEGAANTQTTSIEGIGDKSKTGFMATIPMRIGNLAVVPVAITFISGLPTNVLGRLQGFSHYRTTFNWNKVVYEEIAKQAAATATTTAKKAAALAMSYAVFSRGSRGR